MLFKHIFTACSLQLETHVTMSSCVIDYFDTTDDQPPITDVQGIQQVEDAAEAPILLQVRVVSGFVRFKGWSRVSLRVSSKCLWSILLTKNHIYKGFPQSFYSRDIKGQIEVAITELTPGNSLLRPAHCIWQDIINVQNSLLFINSPQKK